MAWVALCVLGAAFVWSEVRASDPCDGKCTDVAASGLTFSCRFAGPQNATKKAMLLHGFPEWSMMYVPLMQALAAKGIRSVACDQRAYSRGARPNGVAAYNYNLLREDVLAVADAVFGTGARFHLVGHDHGAVLGWYSVGANSPFASRVESYTALSIPHSEAFASGLFGDAADKEQQIASQYFTMFILNDSASIHSPTSWYNMLGRWSGFTSAADFQRALWWYNGAMDVGVLARPPLMTAAELLGTPMWFLREIYGGEADAGAPQRALSGNVSQPVLFVCGSIDTAILCNHAYAKRTADFCTGPYEYLEVACGHDLLACTDERETGKVVAAVVRLISGETETLV